MIDLKSWPVGQTGQGVEKTGIDARKTKPPAYYDEGSLLSDMKSAAKFIVDPRYREALKDANGIGTPATRASIIERLKTLEYLSVEKSTNKLHSSPKGQAIIKGMPAMMVDVGTTAIWEQMLVKVARGEITTPMFMDKIEKNLRQLMIDADASMIHSEKSKSSGKDFSLPCPKCGQLLKQDEKTLKCISGDFIVWLVMSKKKLTEKQLQALVKNKKTDVIDGFVSSKTGKSYCARVKIIEEGDVWKTGFEFSEKEKGEKQNVSPVASEIFSESCPQCQGILRFDGRSVKCDAGDFTLWTEIAKRKMIHSELVELIQKKNLPSRFGFVSTKTGHKFTAGLRLSAGGKIDFVF